MSLILVQPFSRYKKTFIRKKQHLISCPCCTGATTQVPVYAKTSVNQPSQKLG